MNPQTIINKGYPLDLHFEIQQGSGHKLSPEGQDFVSRDNSQAL